MRSIRDVLFTATLALASSATAAETPTDFAVRQPLSTSADKAFFRIELPDAVYDGAGRPDLGDLRIFNGDGAVVPFAFLPRPAPVTMQGERRALAIFPLTIDTTSPNASDLSIKLRRDAAGTSVDVRARDGTPVAGSRVVGYLIDASGDDKPLVALQLPLQEAGTVNARLRIDASDDLDRWRTIVANAPVLSIDYNGRRLKRERVEFTPQRARYLRITWLTASPPELGSVLGDLGDRTIDPPRRVRKATGAREASATDTFTFDLGAALPVDRVTLLLPEVNTVAPVSWEARTRADDPWHGLGASVAYRLRQDDGEVVSVDHAISGVPLRYFRVRIDPKAGGVGATPPTLAAGWIPQEIVFAARGNGPFELAYGSRRIGPGALSVATLVPGYVAGKPLPANIGVATAANPPATANAGAMRDPLDVKRWLLWGTLVVASLLLAYMALRLWQQMRDGDAERGRVRADGEPGAGQEDPPSRAERAAQ
jgi:hypothetical protein